jgi:hypothetical protein
MHPDRPIFDANGPQKILYALLERQIVAKEAFASLLRVERRRFASQSAH